MVGGGGGERLDGCYCGNINFIFFVVVGWGGGGCQRNRWGCNCFVLFRF